MTKKLNACKRWRFYKKFEKRLLEVAFYQQSAILLENLIFCKKTLLELDQTLAQESSKD